MPTARLSVTMGNVIFRVKNLVYAVASALPKLLHQELVVVGLYDCVVVAQQSLRSRVELMLYCGRPVLAFGLYCVYR